MLTRRLLAGLAAALLAVVLAPAPAAVEERPILTASAAMKMVHGCLAKAAAEGWRMHVAILDNHGNLKAYHRMDDAQLLSQEIAMAKARSSALSPRSTQQWSAAAFPASGNGPSPVAFVPGLNFFEGGLPIMTAAGVHVGGIGVSGDTGANDAICAQAGIDAAADDLQ